MLYIAVVTSGRGGGTQHFQPAVLKLLLRRRDDNALDVEEEIENRLRSEETRSWNL